MDHESLPPDVLRALSANAVPRLSRIAFERRARALPMVERGAGESLAWHKVRFKDFSAELALPFALTPADSEESSDDFTVIGLRAATVQIDLNRIDVEDVGTIPLFTQGHLHVTLGGRAFDCEMWRSEDTCLQVAFLRGFWDDARWLAITVRSPSVDLFRTLLECIDLRASLSPEA